MGSVLRKRVASGGEAQGPATLGEDALLDALPGVREMLVTRHYEDGRPRQTSTLLLFVDDGTVKACLNDRDQGLSAWASGATVADCLEALEAGLQADTVAWKASGARKDMKRRK